MVLLDIVFLGTFALILKYRKKILQLKIRGNKFLIYLLISLPFIIVEENLNHAFGYLIPETTLPLLIFLAVLGFLAKLLKAKNYLAVSSLFSIFGIFFEYLFGASGNALLKLNLIESIYVIAFIFMGYMYISLVPLIYLLKK